MNICFLRDTTSAISLAATKDRARGIAVYTPVGAEADYTEILPAEFELVAQRGELLGERVLCALEDLFLLGFSSVCLINSDSPTVPTLVFAEAVAILAQPEKTVVLGPSCDGGYYLIGLKKLYRELFEEISWSTDRVLPQTIERARQMNLNIHLLPKWYDVDDGVTLRRLCDELFGTTEAAPAGYPAPATRSYLEGLMKKEGRKRIWPKEPAL